MSRCCLCGCGEGVYGRSCVCENLNLNLNGWVGVPPRTLHPSTPPDRRLACPLASCARQHGCLGGSPSPITLVYVLFANAGDFASHAQHNRKEDCVRWRSTGDLGGGPGMGAAVEADGNFEGRAADELNSVR